MVAIQNFPVIFSFSIFVVKEKQLYFGDKEEDTGRYMSVAVLLSRLSLRTVNYFTLFIAAACVTTNLYQKSKKWFR